MMNPPRGNIEQHEKNIDFRSFCFIDDGSLLKRLFLQMCDSGIDHGFIKYTNNNSNW